MECDFPPATLGTKITLHRRLICIYTIYVISYLSNKINRIYSMTIQCLIATRVFSSISLLIIINRIIIILTVNLNLLVFNIIIYNNNCTTSVFYLNFENYIV